MRKGVLRTSAVCFVLILQLVAWLASAPVANANPSPVTVTKHANLGFSTSMPVFADTGVASPPCLQTLVGICVFHGAVSFSGTFTASARIAADIGLTYDSADLNTPGGPMPVAVTYTPTPGGSTASYALAGTLTLNFDGCTNCPAALPVSGTSAPISFTAPMDADAPITIPGSSSGITLSIGGTPIITASISSTLTLAPAGPGVVPGLGGAAAVVHVVGASGAPILPIEWD